MGKVANLGIGKRASIVALSDAGYSQREIVTRMHCGLGTVCNTLWPHDLTGSSVDRPCSWRPRVTLPCEDFYIHIARGRRRVTSRMPSGNWHNSEECPSKQLGIGEFCHSLSLVGKSVLSIDGKWIWLCAIILLAITVLMLCYPITDSMLPNQEDALLKRNSWWAGGLGNFVWDGPPG